MIHQQKFREPPAVGYAEKGVGQHVRCPLVCANKFQLKINQWSCMCCVWTEMRQTR